MDQGNLLEKEISDIRKILEDKEKELSQIRKNWYPQQTNEVEMGYSKETLCDQQNSFGRVQMGELPRWAIERYSRQILLSDIGVNGQAKLCSARVLVVGAGGLGCPASVYLAGAGVGEIGLVDYDTVDVTNIHRQILHGEEDQYVSKVDSAALSLRRINSQIKVTTYNLQLDSSNALKIVSNYDVILDCTDNVPTRYLLNDVCALTKLPLISGSALKMEGQITIYGYRAENNVNEPDGMYRGPCYRCLFPSPPPAATTGSCSTSGVAGPVTGVIGAMQALEAIKLLVGQPHKKLLVQRMVLFDGEDMTFNTVKLRPKNPECAACSDTPTITQLIDYETFCKAKAKEKKREEARLKSQRRKEEKVKRMSGQSYYGFRKLDPNGDTKKWVQDVPKSERKIGPACSSDYCNKSTAKFCKDFSEEQRQSIFRKFWNDLDWGSKKQYVRSLVDTIPPKRRRIKHKNQVSRKGDSKLYHLHNKDERVPVCRVMFLNTLGIKEAMVRCWMTETKPKEPKTPIKSLNVDSYIEALPKLPPKCVYCKNSRTTLYINLDHVKNQYQLYNEYSKEMKLKNISPASRKTFAKVCTARNVRFFKPKNESDICDLVSSHNITSNGYLNLDIEQPSINVVNYNMAQW